MTHDEALNPPLHADLEHLTREQVDEVIALYYAGEKVKEIYVAYGIERRSSDITTILPPEVLIDEICDYCALPLWRKRTSKSWPSLQTPYCPNCGHKPVQKCNCQNCEDVRRAKNEYENNRKRSILSSILDISSYQPVYLEELTLTERVYLGAVLRSGLSENAKWIVPFDSFDDPVAPTTDSRERILNTLRNVHALKIHPTSELSCFDEVNDDGSFTFYTYRVNWHLNIVGNLDARELVDSLMNPQKHLDEEIDEVVELWKYIALEECIEYLLFNMNQVGFDFSPGKKTRLVIADLLKSFATSQIYGIVWSGVTHASRYYQEGEIPKKRAANSVITNMQRYGEKALTQGWDPKRFSRVRDCPQSSISKILYNRILGIGDMGFEEVPRGLF